MDISSEKIGELLKNPEIMGMIASVMSGMMSPGGKGDASLIPAEKSGADSDDSSETNNKAVIAEHKDNIFYM